jgi:hypothetical protein
VLTPAFLLAEQSFLPLVVLGSSECMQLLLWQACCVCPDVGNGDAFSMTFCNTYFDHLWFGPE